MKFAERTDRLSLQFHPDKISDGRLKEAAQKAFMDVVMKPC